MILLSEGVLFGRKYRVIVTDNNGVGIDVSNLHCTFTVEKSMSETPNYSEIVIYNLAPQTENKIIKEGAKVILEAGYEDSHYGVIFTGDIVQPLRSKENGTDYTLTLIVQDGDLFYNRGIINTSLKAGQSLRNVINTLSNDTTENIEVGEISENLNNTSLSRGKVLFGLSRDCFRQIAKSEEGAFFINDNKINLVKADDLPKGEIISLNSNSGLIDTPEQTEEGIKAQSLLNPLLNLNKFVHIDRSLINQQRISKGQEIRQLQGEGVYRIISLTHSGDTRGNTWYTEFTAVAQIGAKPITGNSMR